MNDVLVAGLGIGIAAAATAVGPKGRARGGRAHASARSFMEVVERVDGELDKLTALRNDYDLDVSRHKAALAYAESGSREHRETDQRLIYAEGVRSGLSQAIHAVRKAMS